MADAADAKVLADLVRTDRHNHRQLVGDSDSAEAIKVLARAHQNLHGCLRHHSPYNQHTAWAHRTPIAA